VLYSAHETEVKKNYLT